MTKTGTTGRKLVGAVVASLSGMLGMVMLTASPALAAAFSDGSFETPDIATNFQVFTTGQMIGPWQVTGTSVDLVDGVLNGTPGSDGVQWIDLAGSPGPGGLQQSFDTVNGQQYTVSYDVGNRCAVSTDARAFVNGVLVDSVTFATNSPFVTRTFVFAATGPSTSLAFDTTSTTNCGTSLDNVRFVPRPVAAPASQCTGAVGHKVQFRKVSTTITSDAVADQAMALPPTDPAVLARATDNGVPTINYSDGGFAEPSQAGFAPLRDVQTPPLTPVAGTFLAAADPNFVMRSSGYISVPTAGVWTFTVHGDDMFRLAIGSPPQVLSATAVPSGDSTTSAPVNFPAAGCYYYTLQHANGGGPSSVSLSATGPGQPTPTLVGLGLLPVFQGVDNPTSCKIVAVRRAPNSSDGFHDDMDVNVTDADTIGAIYNVVISNGTASFPGVPLAPGQTTLQVVRATKAVQGQSTTWSFDVADWNGVTKHCA